MDDIDACTGGVTSMDDITCPYRSTMQLLYQLVPALAACCKLQVGTCCNIHPLNWSLIHPVAEVIIINFVEMSPDTTMKT